MKKLFLIIAILVMMHEAMAQAPSLQDPSLDNLVLPAGYKTCKPGTLGSVKKMGSGEQSIIIIPGLGFGPGVFSSFIDHYKKEYRIYAITAAGFEETAAPPVPDSTVKYNELSWTNGIVTGVLDLIKKEKLDKPIIIAHFVTATQVAFELAANHPGEISKIIIIGGSPYRYYASQEKDGTYSDWEYEKMHTSDQREKLVDLYWAPRWFKTVTKKTWDDNMWTAEDYCKDSLIGKDLFNSSAKVPVQVMIRYLIEWMAYDANEKYKDIKVPTLVLIPDFKELLRYDSKDTASCKSAAAKAYLNYFHKDVWIKAKNAANPVLQFETIAGTRIFMWYDEPLATYKAINNFLK